MSDPAPSAPVSPSSLEGSGGEPEASSRCPKKPKTHLGDPCNDSDMAVPLVSRDDILPDSPPSPRQGSPFKSFVDAVKMTDDHSDEPHYYMGDDDEEKISRGG